MRVSFTSVVAIALLAIGFIVTPANADDFYPIAGITSSTSADDLFPVANLIQGPGVGFNADAPYEKLISGAAGNWVTAAPGGFPSDFIAVAGEPVLTLDLGADTVLSSIAVWGYAVTNANGVEQYTLAFGTDADGLGGIGTSIAYNPTVSGLSNEDSERQDFVFSEAVTARYVEFTANATFFGGEVPGGDRVGLGEIAFPVPEPSTIFLAISGLVAMGLVIRRRK